MLDIIKVDDKNYKIVCSTTKENLGGITIFSKENIGLEIKNNNYSHGDIVELVGILKYIEDQMD